MGLLAACGLGGEPSGQGAGQERAAQAPAQPAKSASGPGAPAILAEPEEAPAAPRFSEPGGPLDEGEFRALMEPFELERVAENLQGTWVFAGGVNPVPSAWHVEGGAFSLIDAKGDVRAGTLRVLAPCKIAHVVDSGLREVVNFSTMVATAQGVHRAGASMGVLRGELFAVCTSSGIILGDGSGCGLWRDVGGVEPRWERSPATCHFIRGGADTLELSAEALGTVMLTRYGELLLRWPPDEALAERVGGPDAAIARLRAAASALGE